MNIIGAGIIGLPFALKQAGFGLGLGLLFIMCFITRYSLGVLVGAGILMRCRSYENTASMTLGRAGEKLVLASQFGVYVCVYVHMK
jgi:solute carrier family 38 (sodium-coupled neutral amino acid transporter), member 11